MKTDDELLAEANALDAHYAEAEQATFEGQAEAFEKDLRALVDAARSLVDNRTPMLAEQMEFALRQALGAFEPWLDQEDENDYRGMGWVDDRGRP